MITTTTTTDLSTNPPAPISGDFNGDNEITIADAVLLARFVEEDATLTDEEMDRIVNAEPVQDEVGLVTILDVTAILRKLTDMKDR